MDASVSGPFLGEGDNDLMSSVITNNAYPYQLLKEELEEIRLVVRAPAADPSEPPNCGLVHVSLARLPSYKALSYTWGAEYPYSPSFSMEATYQ